jgi:putative transposase
MGRIARYDVLYDVCYAHVISRSIRKMRIFNDAQDFEEFKRLLLEVKKRKTFKLFHYCIMQTHFHLAVEMTDVKEFSYAMRDLKRSYVYWFHKKYKISGPVWRERFRSLLIENQNYLSACGKYIEDNPLKAGLVNQSESWEYSSCKHYKCGNLDELVDKYESSVSEIEGLIFDKEEFEDGSIVGSSFFKFEFQKSRKSARRVP